MVMVFLSIFVSVHRLRPVFGRPIDSVVPLELLDRFVPAVRGLGLGSEFHPPIFVWGGISSVRFEHVCEPG